ncbi:MAG: DmsC/YnfH family molybdoenzyme membrane anchor subunit [Pseudomonadota bacterium]
MNPAFSIIAFTTLAGSAQGLVVVLAIATLLGAAPPPGFVAGALAVALLLLLAALGASFLHLGHKLRAWRAVLMWRTSWMSREVIVLPAFIALVAAWAASVVQGVDGPLRWLLPVLVLLLSAALWVCTAMIYACLRFVQEWAHPLTVVNYTLIGLSGGMVLAGALGVVGGQPGFAAAVGPWALLATLAAWATRMLALRRNARLRPRSTLQSATGIQNPQLVQTSMGLTAGSYNTREFFHRASLAGLRRIKLGFIVFGFAVPAILLACALWAGPAGGAAWLLAVPLQTLGILAERWFFFAQARHPQNLYYQVVS